MEDEIKRNFCNLCLNKGINCMNIYSEIQEDVEMYKCVNYVRNDVRTVIKTFDYIINSDEEEF